MLEFLDIDKYSCLPSCLCFFYLEFMHSYRFCVTSEFLFFLVDFFSCGENGGCLNFFFLFFVLSVFFFFLVFFFPWGEKGGFKIFFFLSNFNHPPFSPQEKKSTKKN